MVTLANTKPVLEQLGPYIVALLALAGVLVGKQLDRSHGVKAWLRDQRKKHYAELLTAATDLWNLLSEAYLDPPATDDDEAHAAISTAETQFNRAVVSAEIVLPEKDVPKVNEVQNAMKGLMHLVLYPHQRAASKSEHRVLEQTPEHVRLVKAEHDLRQAVVKLIQR